MDNFRVCAWRPAGLLSDGGGLLAAGVPFIFMFICVANMKNWNPIYVTGQAVMDVLLKRYHLTVGKFRWR